MYNKYVYSSHGQENMKTADNDVLRFNDCVHTHYYYYHHYHYYYSYFSY